MTTWAPQQQHLADLLNVLRLSGSADSQLQKRILQHIEGLSTVADFNCYLCYILCELEEESEQVRATAGLHMKNNILRQQQPTNPAVSDYVQGTLLRRLLGAPLTSRILRSTLSTAVAALAQSLGKLSRWPQLLPTLLLAADPAQLRQHMPNASDDHLAATLVSAFATIEKVLEDAAAAIDDPTWQAHGAQLLQRILETFQSPVLDLRVLALGCFNHLLAAQSSQFLQFLPTFVEGIFRLASDTSPEVVKYMCHAIVNIWECRSDLLQPSLNQIIEYMLTSSQHDDETVAIEASEFWLSIAESTHAEAPLLAILPRLIPVLLKNMVYSEVDIALLDNDDDNYLRPDRAEDINPSGFHHSARSQGAGKGGSGKGEYDENDEDGDGDGDDDDDEAYEWNLRKCSASSLDTIASTFHDRILEVLLPLLQQYLTSSDRWEVRESGILALGAIAEGCMDGIAPHLPQLIPFLLSNLNHEKALVRSITCWTLSRYVTWIGSPSAPDVLFNGLIQGIMERIMDPSKRVQEAACSAFSVIEEEYPNRLMPILEPIVAQLANAFRRYQAKNMLILYDTVSTLAENVGQELNKPNIIQSLMPPLIMRWNSIADDSKDLIPLLECLGSIAKAIGHGFEPFAPAVFARAVQIIGHNQQIAIVEAQTTGFDMSEKDIMVTALDLISALVEGLGSSVESLVSNSPLFQYLFNAMNDQQSSDARQSAFALVGDLARNVFPHLQAHIPQYLPVMIENMNPFPHVAVCNNAIWASGEIAVVLGANMSSFIPGIMNKIVVFYQQQNVSRYLMENVSITIGRFGLAAPNLIAPHLHHFFGPWCSFMRSVIDDREKVQAVRGMLQMLALNPAVISSHFASFCDVIIGWSNIPMEIDQIVGNMLTQFRASFNAQDWATFWSSIPQAISHILSQRYNLN